MDNKSFIGDRIGKRDVSLALLSGIGFFFVYLIFSPRGLDPSLWDEMTVAAGIRPPQTVFAGVWRLLTAWLLSLFGSAYIIQTLRIIGAAIGGISTVFVYFVLRQILASLTRVKSFERWNWIAPLFATIATVCFCAGDVMFRITAPVTPAAFRFLALILSLHFFLQFVKRGGLLRILVSMAFAGLLAAETLVGFLLPAIYYVVQRLALAEALNEKQQVDADPGHLAYMPRWRMFFSFVSGLVLLVGVNITAFVLFGGLEANGWSGFDVTFHYVVKYYGFLASAASPIG